MIPEEIFMVPVESSNVASIGYDAIENILYVEFLSKDAYAPAQYMYYGVEPEIYEQMMAAPSKGRFVWTHLRDRYDYERIQ